MSKTYRHGERRIKVRGIRRPTDLRRLAQVLIELEAAQAETDAEAEHQTRSKPSRQRSTKRKAGP
jgi:hypothetical protein